MSKSPDQLIRDFFYTNDYGKAIWFLDFCFCGLTGKYSDFDSEWGSRYG